LPIVTKAIELDPTLAEAYNDWAYAYNGKGEPDKAIADCDKAIELDPTLAEAYFFRGVAYAEKDEVAKAVSDLERCIELSSDPELVELAQQMLE
jgi:tetratricopeptide (TPR) repeat protein